MQSDDNQSRRDDQSGQVEHANGLYISIIIMCVGFYYCTYLCGH